MSIAVTGTCILSSAGETAFALCDHCVTGKANTEHIDLQVYEKEIASLNTGTRELYRIQKLLLIALARASHMAGPGLKVLVPERTGIFLGNSYGIEEFKTEFFRLYKKSDPALTSPSLFPFTTANALASWLAIQTGYKGPSLTFTSGSTSSADAILAACDALDANECDTAFVGGASVIDNNLSDEFYRSGFRYESAGMIVLERADNVKSLSKKPLAIIKNRQSATLTQVQMERIDRVHCESCSGNDAHGRSSKEYAEMLYLGNNLGDSVFSFNRNDCVVLKNEHKALYLNDVVGNVFDAAGVFGVALCADLINISKDVSWRFVGPADNGILYSQVSSSGAAVTMLINKA